MVVPSLPRQEPPPNQRHVRPAPWSHGLPNSNTGPDRPIHKRKSKKSAYQLQREERDELLRVADELDAQLEALRLRAGFRTRRYHEEMDACQALKDALKANVYENERYLIRLDSLLTAELLLPVINPNATFIHLPKDMDKRRQVLRGLETVKLRRGIETVIDRLGHFDEFLPYKCEDWLTTESGECHFYRADIVQFRNFQTAVQLHDTFVQFLYNMEINLTEMLGHLTLREDVEEIAEPTIWNHRFVTYSSELPTELNLVGFAQFYDYSPITSSPVGMILCDTVNVDDLYPYKPQERACKDAQSFNLVYEACDPVTKDVVVILKQITFIVQLRPQFAFSHSEWKKLLANIPRWPNAIHKYLREYVVPLKPHDSSVRQ